jgi:hypothetical protein
MRMNYGENVFQLDNPNQWYCQVRHFTWSHGMLDIQLSTPGSGTKDRYSITFRKVMYHSGPMVWTGANFRAFELDDDAALNDFLAHHPLPASRIRFAGYSAYSLFYSNFEDNFKIVIIANAGWLSKPSAPDESKTLASVPR